MQVHCLLGRVFSMLVRVQPVTMRQVSMVARTLVVASLRVLGCFAMMLRGRIEVLGCFVMMVMNFVLIAHGSLQYLQRGPIHNRSRRHHDSEMRCHLREPIMESPRHCNWRLRSVFGSSRQRWQPTKTAGVTLIA
jgi:hypothetical protein